MKKILFSGIMFYRRWISPVLPGSCRFYPTCSAYAMEAVDKYGALKGSVKAAGRIMRCHPWHPGGYDPVSKIPKPESEEFVSQDEDVRNNKQPGVGRDKIISAPRAPRPAHLEQ